MEDSDNNFLESIRNSLNKKLKFINEVTIGNIKASVPEYRENLSTIISSLFNAGLLEKDLYKSTQMIHELKLPSMEPIEASKKDSELSFRLYNYLSQFEYIEKDMKFMTDQLSIKEIKDLITFFSYISWSKFSQDAASPVESLLSKLETRIKNSNNKILIGIFRDSRTRLIILEKCILSSLEDILIYLQEKYKLEVRTRVVRTEIHDTDLAKKNIDEALLIFKKQVKVEMGEVGLHTDLLRTILEEDYSADAENIRAQTIKNICINHTEVRKKEKKKPKEKKEDNGKLLIEGFKLLSASGSALLEVSKKLTHNADVLESAQKGFFYKIFFFLFGKQMSEQCRIYDIVVFFANNEDGQRLKIDLDAFADELTKEGYKLVLVGNQNSKTFLSLIHMSEKRREEILTNYIEKIALYLSKLPAIDLYMKNKSTNAMRAEMKGFKLDLNNIQSCLNKANNRRLEYLSKTNQLQDESLQEKQTPA
jgi:hypothetical protein